MAHHYRWLHIGIALFMLSPGLCLARGGADLSLEIFYKDQNRHLIPGNCSNWHEVYPQYCGGYHQSQFIDNGDEVLSDGDQVQLTFAGTGCITITISGVMPICHSTGDSLVVQPLMWDPQNPICTEWVELTPHYGVMHHVTDWQDNGDGAVGVCDIFVFENETSIHIEGWEVGTDAVITTPVQNSDWSRLKRLFMFPF